jgi:TolA-binding protein
MYIKWWSLRRVRDKEAQVAVIELELLKRYGDDPMVAPIMLSQATDLLAGQNYTDAYNILLKLVEKFPETAAATQAKKMIEKLKTTKQTK